jgi:hypothetical protein
VEAVSADLVAFLRQRLDEDEQVARAAIGKPSPTNEGLGPGVWRAGGGIWDEVVDGDDMTIYAEGGHTPEQAQHIARWDPAAVLREVEAKRRIIDLHRPVQFTNAELGIVDAIVCFKCHSRMDSPDDWPEDEDWPYPLVQDPYPCLTVRLSALPWASHEDYRAEEWAP